MSSPTDTVMAFLAMCEKPGGFADAVRAFFTSETRYINVGMTDSTGIEAGIAVVDSFEAAMGATSLRVDMLALAEILHTTRARRLGSWTTSRESDEGCQPSARSSRQWRCDC